MEKVLYPAVNAALFEFLPPRMERVLDIGCGTGSLGRELRKRGPCAITGLTYAEEEAALARDALDEVIVADLNTFDFDSLAHYDTIICSHVLEHVHYPSEVVAGLRPHLSPGGTIIVAVPNVLWWRQRLLFLRGKFRYTETGLMDRTHRHFFDWQTARDLLPRAGFADASARAFGYFPGSWISGPLKPSVDTVALKALPGLFGDQFVMVGHQPTTRPAPAAEAA